MSLIQSLILGLVEGVTEFLPISSTAHLILTSQLLQIEQSEFIKLFEVVIQSGAILAVIILYWRLITNNKYLISSILISFIPTALIGFFLHDTIKSVFFESNLLIAATLLGGGVLFVLLEYFLQKGTLKLNQELAKMSVSAALLIGSAQALAVVPGVSRAGAVIVAMILLRYKRSDSAIYSFLLAVPTIIAASIFDLIKTDVAVFNHSASLVYLTVGFITAFISAYIVIKWFITYLQKNTLILFGWYRVAVAIGVLFLL